MSKFIQILAALMYVDYTDLYAFNDGFMCTIEIVIKAQMLLNAYHEALRFIDRDLKLSKCYWTLQDYR